MEAKTAIFIDWDGTLSKSRFWQQWRDDPADASKYAAIEKVLFGSPNDLLQTWMLGKISAEQVVEYAAEQTGLASELLLEKLRDSCSVMQIVPGAQQLIDRARSIGYKVLIATDNMDTFSRWTVPTLGLDEHFDDILNSADIGALKNDIAGDGSSKFFAATMKKYSLSLTNAIIVDDSSNSQPFQQLGMIFHKVENPFDTVLFPESILEE